MSDGHNGYIALHRKLLDNPIVCKDADHLAIWVWLLLKASWKESDVLFNGERITLKPGDLPPISRRTIADELKISDSKVQRVLKRFENEHQIEQRTSRSSRLISIVSWDSYQSSEPPIEPLVNHERTTSEPRVNTIEERNKGNNSNKGNKKRGRFAPPTLSEVDDYIKEKGYHINAESFIAFYSSKNWMVGKNKMTSWKSAVATWEQRWKEEHNGSKRTDEPSHARHEETIPDGWENIFGRGEIL